MDHEVALVSKKWIDDETEWKSNDSYKRLKNSGF